MASVVNNFKKPKNRKNKIELVFDSKDRKEFLTGFRKRKQQRKKAAQERLEKALKDEKKRLKKEARETFKKLVGAHRPSPILENLFSKEYDEDDVTVRVTELSTAEIADKNNWIGENKPEYEDENEEEEEEEDARSDEDSAEEEIPGMELERTMVKTPPTEGGGAPTFSSKREVKRSLMKQATIKMQKSKAFQMKNRIEQHKMKNKSRRLKRENKKREKRLSKRKGKK